MEKNTFRVIRQTMVNTPQSLMTMRKGSTVSVLCKDFAPYSTVKSAASRLNKRAGHTEFVIESPDNGYTIHVTRKS
jgi:hypothetical protein